MKIFITLFALMLSMSSFAAPSKPFKLCWSHYTGWEPYGYADKQGTFKKWAKKYGVEVEVVLFNDYVESINQFTAKTCDATTMTTLEALTMPAKSGVDSTVLIIGDFSDGNDAVVAKGVDSFKALKGQTVTGVELSVSHYLFARALKIHKLSSKDVKFVNIEEGQIVPSFKGAQKTVTATWNPHVNVIKGEGKVLFDSSQIPGEIIDSLVVRTDAPEALKKALVGAWYETMREMSSSNNQKIIEFMATNATANGTVKQFLSQLKTTQMFYKPADAVAFTKQNTLKNTMKYIRDFSFEKGLLKGKDSNYVGIQFPDGTIDGNPKNVKLRFVSKYMQMAADNKL